MSLNPLTSDQQAYIAHLSVQCYSYRLLHIRKWPLPNGQVTQLIVSISVVTFDGKRDVLTLPLTPGRNYREIHIQLRSKHGNVPGRTYIHFTSIPEENEG